MRGTDYFITCCLQRPDTGLTNVSLAPRIQARLLELETSGHWHVRTSVLMPDHLHLLVTLDSKSSLPEVIRLFKGALTPALRKRGLRWQQNFYDHHLRPSDELLPTFLYIFLNPYRAGLIQTDQKWPWYTCSPRDWEWFGGMTKKACPYPEWLGT
jgi:REP element-mobilizing transposase RayT